MLDLCIWFYYTLVKGGNIKMDIPVRQWIARFQNNEFDGKDFNTQVEAGWYDWFCKTSSLRNKTYKMGNIVKKIKGDGKVYLDTMYVWFKNNCPCVGPLYDDFRFADIKTGNVIMTICVADERDIDRYVVYGRKNGFESPLFHTNDSRKLAKWLNEPWEE